MAAWTLTGRGIGSAAMTNRETAMDEPELALLSDALTLALDGCDWTELEGGSRIGHWHDR
jgi:hypothetical protein